MLKFTSAALTTAFQRPLARPMSGMWPKGFQEPIKHKKEFPESKLSGVFEEKTLNPIKAAPNDATCSLFKQDDKIRKFTCLVMKYSEREKADIEMRRTFKLIKKAQLAKYYKSSDKNKTIVINPQELLLKAIENARPLMALETVSVGSMEYTVPTPITLAKSEYQGMKWILLAARDRDKEKSLFHEKLSEVVLETAAYQGRVINIKDEHHKICEINRAYAHYRRSK